MYRLITWTEWKFSMIIESESNVSHAVLLCLDVNSASDYTVQMCKLICIFAACHKGYLDLPKQTETLEGTRNAETTKITRAVRETDYSPAAALLEEKYI